MAHRIEVALKPELEDVLGERVARRGRELLGLSVDEVRIVDVYTIDGGDLTSEELAAVAGGPLCDPVIQRARVDRPLAGECDWVLEVGYRPGVTDNVGRTAREAIELVVGRPLGPGAGVYTSKQYLLRGGLGRQEVDRLAGELLGNSLVQHWRVSAGAGFEGFPPVVPSVTASRAGRVDEIDLDLDDAGLEELSRRRLLALTAAELRAVRDYFGRPEVAAARAELGLGPKPTDVEIECIAQSWSEHCKHKIFNARIRYEDETAEETIIDGLFGTFIQGATEQVVHLLGPRNRCVSVFEDNAGVVEFDDEWLLTVKVETHNSPSALDPYGGALTGIVGVNRDPMGTGMGAELVFNTDVFCLADPRFDGELPPRLLHPRRILEGVREGVEHGGNKSGIPTVNGSVVFDDRYLGKPLVYCGTGGLIPRKTAGRPGHEKDIRPGHRIVMVGGRVGKDGIHGATFSSEELHEGSPASAVQIGDPITQKRMGDFLLRARDLGLYSGLTDNGAGGLSSSIGETARASGGAEVDLARAPLKYEGLDPWEVLVSESQERMTVAVPPERLDRFLGLAARMGVEAADLGEYTSTGAFVVRQGDRVVSRLDLDFLHDGLPRMSLPARWRPPVEGASGELPGRAELGSSLRAVLGRLNVCSKEYWVRQYDHEVQGGSVVKPLVGARDDGPSDGAVLRPRLGSMRAIAVTHGICPRYGDLDTFHMAQCAVDEAVRSAVALGADPGSLYALDNFCWTDPVETDRNPEGAYKLAQLVRAAMGLYDACVAYRLPLISGKDSMRNDYRGGGVTISIPPTLLVSVVGVVEDARRAVTMDAKRPGDLVYLIGATHGDLGRSELSAELGLGGGSVPQVRDLRGAAESYLSLHRAMTEQLVASCHDCSDGGLAVALAETAFAGELGLEVELGAVPTPGGGLAEAAVLFCESPCRLVATVAPADGPRFEALLRGRAARIGRVTDDGRLRVLGWGRETVLDEDIHELKAAWKGPLGF